MFSATVCFHGYCSDFLSNLNILMNIYYIYENVLISIQLMEYVEQCIRSSFIDKLLFEHGQWMRSTIITDI